MSEENRVAGEGGSLAIESQPSAGGVRVGQNQLRGVNLGCSECHPQENSSGQVMPTSNGQRRNLMVINESLGL